jgi:hypothetical protein
LGRVPFQFAKFLESFGPFDGLALAGGSVLLEQSGIEGVDAFGPLKPAGPVFDGAEFFIEFVGDRLKGADLVQLEIGPESAIGARGFTGRPGKHRDHIRS